MEISKLYKNIQKLHLNFFLNLKVQNNKKYSILSIDFSDSVINLLAFNK